MKKGVREVLIDGRVEIIAKGEVREGGRKVVRVECEGGDELRREVLRTDEATNDHPLWVIALEIVVLI